MPTVPYTLSPVTRRFALPPPCPTLSAAPGQGAHLPATLTEPRMGNMLFYAHSGLRFLVLLFGVVAVVVLLAGWRSGRPFTGPSRAVTAMFTGALDLQILLGIGTVLTRPWYGALMGHLIMMIAAALAVHGITVYARKQPDARRAHSISLVGVVLGLLLIVGGIMAIRSSPFEMTPGAGATATSTR